MRDVTVRAGGQVVAETRRPVAVFETGLPTRWYLPLADVDTHLLRPSTTTTICPYRGEATYWSIVGDGSRIDDAVWTYRTPLGEALATAGHVSFLADGVDVEVA